MVLHQAESKATEVEAIKAQLSFQNAVELTKFINPKLGEEIIDRMRKEGFVVRKEEKKKIQRFADVKQAQEEEFMALPKLDDQFVKKQQK